MAIALQMGKLERGAEVILFLMNGADGSMLSQALKIRQQEEEQPQLNVHCSAMAFLVQLVI